MTEQEYKDILDQNVDEVKKSIKELDQPDYKKLLKLEKGGEDRKTIKEYIEKNMEKEEVELEESEEEAVEEIEEETSNGLLEGFTSGQVLAGGAILGLLIGLIMGLALNDLVDTPVEGADFEEDLENYLSQVVEQNPQIEASEISIVETVEEHGMFVTTVELEATVENESQVEQANFYISPDGELLFEEMPGVSPVVLEDALTELENMPEEGAGLPEQGAEEEIEIDPEDIEDLQ